MKIETLKKAAAETEPSKKTAAKKAALTVSPFDSYSEQDTADKLILPYLANTHRFPKPDSLDYQAQHNLVTEPGKTGRYDGLYLSGGYPYVVLEATRAAALIVGIAAHRLRRLT
jgi:hypothetical protein